MNDNALVQLTIIRFREFMREPEALFWVFVFPILMATGLGIAFRNRPPEVLPVGAVTLELAEAMKKDPLLDVRQFSGPDGAEALRVGKIVLLAVPSKDRAVEYRFDDTNPEGRTARMIADRAVQKAAGRVDPVTSDDRIMREADRKSTRLNSSHSS